jgi:cystathionine beta-synthase
MCGVAKYLKEQNPNITSVGIDTYGSVFKKYKETGKFDENEIYPYLTEGIGEDILPKNVDFSVIDTFVKVTDKDGALMTRRLAKEEGLFVGWSCGSAVKGALDYAKNHLTNDDVMVIILPDHGTRYLGKIYNDNWMKDHGYTESGISVTALDIIHQRGEKDELFTIESSTSIGKAIALISEKGIDQAPIVDNGQFVGSISDTKILRKLIEQPDIKDQPVAEIMDPSFRFVASDNTVDVLSSLLNKENKALLVREGDKVHIITQSDLLVSLTR